MNLDARIPVSPRSGSGVNDASTPFDLILARRILIAEDDDLIRWIISNTLADNGYAVKTAADGEEAWEALLHDSYDLCAAGRQRARHLPIAARHQLRDQCSQRRGRDVAALRGGQSDWLPFQFSKLWTRE